MVGGPFVRCGDSSGNILANVAQRRLLRRSTKIQISPHHSRVARRREAVTSDIAVVVKNPVANADARTLLIKPHTVIKRTHDARANTLLFRRIFPDLLDDPGSKCSYPFLHEKHAIDFALRASHKNAVKAPYQFTNPVIASAAEKENQ